MHHGLHILIDINIVKSGNHAEFADLQYTSYRSFKLAIAMQQGRLLQLLLV